jgi:predicted nucleic acid-binding protein
MKVAVKDANILIDLIESDLLGLWFKLGIQTYVSDLVQLEIIEDDQKRVFNSFVDAGLLIIARLSSDELNLAFEKREKHKISIEDASALIIAQRKSAILLSGDNRLRKTAEGEGVKVFGVIWVFDRLIEEDLLTPQDAINKLRSLLEIGSFLPKAIREGRIHKWKTKASVLQTS